MPSLASSYILKVIPRLLGALLIVTASCSPTPYQIQRAKRLYKQGQILSSQGQREAALKKFHRSIELSKRAGFEVGVAHNLNEIAIIYTATGEYEKAMAALREALSIYKRVGMAIEVSKSLNNIALIYVKQGKFQEAIKAYIQLLRWDREAKNQLGIGITLSNMGHIYERHLRDLKKALDCYERALDIFQGLNRPKYISVVKSRISKLRRHGP